MRLSISKSKNSTSLYVIKSTYENGIHSSKVVESLGTVEELNKKLDGRDPIEWAKEYIAKLNEKEKLNKREVLVKYSPVKIIDKGQQRLFNGGYLFLQKIYHELKLDKMCWAIAKKYNFSYDLNSILSRLVYARVIYPSSKLSTYQLSSRFMEQPSFDLHQIYRALEIIAKEADSIQASLYSNSLAVSKRNTRVLYYDCTNYFFEIEQESGIKQYGYSKEHRPNPIVQMGLFMDGDGVPLAVYIGKGNTNEQLTLKPLEKKILSDFNCSKFIVCTDAGLASNSNRQFNNQGERAFITTQSIKKLKKHLKEWALSPEGWHLPDDSSIYSLDKIDEKKDLEKIFYKERWIVEDGLEQKLIVSFSLKYQNYQRKVRNAQIERARKVLDTNLGKLKKVNQNDYKRFIKKTSITPEGEVASKAVYEIDNSVIQKEEAFDGFYAVCTNLDGDTAALLTVNRRRWRIEECFRIMKSEFRARPVYLSRDDRITAHFITCFIALVVYRLLEKKLGEQYTCSEIVQGLRDMNFYEVKGEGFVPTYMRTDFTDSLHDAFGFRTDYQILTMRQMKNIFKATKS
ncbi:IS1634 family transposase [Syntrophomonas wolfei]|uniref:Transposase-like protein n=1 Tax=Syntrophomonas wolfei subsp. wolfei (strain DSM 2245B / Goettingen) TaxID=335541 RepID=Q0AUS5_SYNWW|nr:IS1634 family transposase [Syntrophomonas wolfei]ABI69043.1 Transposase-like protein [Syntrophomonas wolfei subsp. wolfei str. Goettingen G311]ABI69529.1 Transposase-like protein [Syntrophomonas wolfei subsp. wolfei str. Goettingen G311]